MRAYLRRLVRIFLGQEAPGLPLALAVFAAFLFYGMAYRLRLGVRLYQEGERLFGFQPQKHPVLLLVKDLWHDLVFATVLAAIVWVVALLWSSEPERPASRDAASKGRGEGEEGWLSWKGRIGWFGFQLVIVFLGFVHAAHFNLMMTMSAGLSYEVAMESQTAFSPTELLRFITFLDAVFVFLAWFLLLVVSTIQGRSFWLERALILLVVATTFFHLAQPDPPGLRIAHEIRHNALFFFVADVVRHTTGSDRDLWKSSSSGRLSRAQADRSSGVPAPVSASSSLGPTVSLPSSPSPSLQPAPRAALAPLAPSPLQPSPANGVSGRKSEPRERGGRTAEVSSPPRNPQLWMSGLQGTRLSTGASEPFGAAGSISEEQRRSVRWIDPGFVSGPIPVKALPVARGQERWNVLLFLMESTGFQYIFSQRYKNPVPMPTLQKLARDGWLFHRHFSPSNSSPRSIFSIYSGLNPNPHLPMFSLRRDVSVPSWRSFAGGYDSFLVTPGPLSWYFPQTLLARSGLREMYGYYELPVKHNPSRILARHEVETADFFLKRLKKAKEPFWTSYLSFVPHFPYTDYGPEYRVIPDIESAQKRYLNNLFLLDKQIKKIVDHLEETGRMKRTILVFTGDHGEAFGQHPGNWTHSRHSFNENFHIPLLFYQPRLFPSRRDGRLSTHADILPTLLDGMGIAYNAALFQGESHFAARPRRKYIFLFGNENTLSSMSQEGIKLQLSVKYRRCWVYDLRRDPQEKQPLSCDAYEEQKRATLLYRDYQPQILESYNEACKKKQPFFSHKHP